MATEPNGCIGRADASVSRRTLLQTFAAAVIMSVDSHREEVYARSSSLAKDSQEGFHCVCLSLRCWN